MPADPKHTDGRIDCTVNQNFLTIRGIKGRPILDADTNSVADGTYVQKGILVLNGHDITIDNLEVRNANAGDCRTEPLHRDTDGGDQPAKRNREVQPGAAIQRPGSPGI